ncbi:hypothetical protein GCM10022293_57600 [Azospirillum formosense]
MFDSWHCAQVLAPKPGTLRDGAPVKDRVLPADLERVRRKLAAAQVGPQRLPTMDSLEGKSSPEQGAPFRADPKTLTQAD